MPRQQVTFAAVGDIMLDNGVSKNIERKGTDFPFLNVTSELRKADIVFGNLENPLTKCQEKVIWDFSKYGLSGRAKQIFLKGSPDAAIGLKNAGFNVVSVANNHILDYGLEGARESIMVLRENGIMSVGFGMDTRKASAPKLLRVKDIRFAFLACSFAYEATFFSPGVAPIALRILNKQIKKARERSDIIVVSLHLGEEFEDSPSGYTRKLARSLIETGAELVLCHHPHTLQGIETYRNGLIVYSLGNFVFDYDAFLKRALKRGYRKESVEKSKQSIILKCTVRQDGLIDYSILPVQLNKEFQPTLVSRNSKVGQEIAEKVKTPQSTYCSPFEKKAPKGAVEALAGLAVIFGRRDFKSLYILLRKILDRLYEIASLHL